MPSITSPTGNVADSQATIAANLSGPVRLTAALVPPLRKNATKA